MLAKRMHESVNRGTNERVVLLNVCVLGPSGNVGQPVSRGRPREGKPTSCSLPKRIEGTSWARSQRCGPCSLLLWKGSARPLWNCPTKI